MKRLAVALVGCITLRCHADILLPAVPEVSRQTATLRGSAAPQINQLRALVFRHWLEVGGGSSRSRPIVVCLGIEAQPLARDPSLPMRFILPAAFFDPEPNLLVALEDVDAEVVPETACKPPLWAAGHDGAPHLLEPYPKRVVIGPVMKWWDDPRQWEVDVWVGQYEARARYFTHVARFANGGWQTVTIAPRVW